MAIVADLGSAIAVPSARVISRPQPAAAIAQLRCLVVAENPSRRAMFAAAAEEVGWDVIVCDSVDTGWHVCERERYEMAIADMAALPDSAPMRDLVSQMASHPNLLLMICGNEGDGLEEIWARQLGAWLYLPGVSERCDVEMLCRQGLPVAERLSTGGD